MNTLYPQIDKTLKRPVYLQLYDYIKNEILNGALEQGQRLPSLRTLAKSLSLSITTIEMAYTQLLVEGYISSRPGSGYRVHPADIARVQQYPPLPALQTALTVQTALSDPQPRELPLEPQQELAQVPRQQETLYDLSCFDFVKWKKCANRILNDYPHLLLSEATPQGELELRQEIARYVYQSRGVRCHPEQVVIAAGTQQITSIICTMLQKLSIHKAVVENPGYQPVQKIMQERGLELIPTKVESSGLSLTDLPKEERVCVYVSPSNQFPTGAVMPIGKRYQLLSWAAEHDSVIIEDDYDSELRYFGKPIPSLQGLDQQDRVIYLGSFSSTLFPAIRISYMVVPAPLLSTLMSTITNYAQTCSKAEQLTLAMYMGQGLYQIHLKKLRKLYAQKLQQTVQSLRLHFRGMVGFLNTSSGIHLLLWISNDHSRDRMLQAAASLGLRMVLHRYGSEDRKVIIFYYNQIPLEQIEPIISKLAETKIFSMIKNESQYN